MECKYAKLSEYLRNNLAEQTHFGIIIRMNKEKVITRIGEDNNSKFYHRSCMKPMQASLLIDYNLDKEYNLSEEEIAISCGSHAGEDIHRKYVMSILDKAGLREDDLLCPPIPPISKNEQIKLLLSGEKERKLHNNCSGKHAIMLALCKHLKYDISDYKNINHPLTKIVINKISELCEIQNNDFVISKDGCGLPVIASTLEQLGRGYLNLFTDEKYIKIRNAFLNHPYLIGGENRLDSEIINASNNLIAKVGAGGLCVVVNLDKEECLVVKIADSNTEARSNTVITALKQLKWLDDNMIKSGHINKIYIKEIYSQDNEVLGCIKPCFNLV